MISTDVVGLQVVHLSRMPVMVCIILIRANVDTLISQQGIKVQWEAVITFLQTSWKMTLCFPITKP